MRCIKRDWLQPWNGGTSRADALQNGAWRRQTAGAGKVRILFSVAWELAKKKGGAYPPIWRSASTNGSGLRRTRSLLGRGATAPGAYR